MTLLAAERKDAIAALRAHFWRRKLERVGFSDEPFMSFLADAAADPQAALVASQADSLDPPLVQLRAWVAALDARPLPTYELEPYQEAPSGGPAGAALALPRRRVRRPAPPRHLYGRVLAPAPAAAGAPARTALASDLPGHQALFHPARPDGRWRPLGRRGLAALPRPEPPGGGQPGRARRPRHRALRPPREQPALDGPGPAAAPAHAGGGHPRTGPPAGGRPAHPLVGGAQSTGPAPAVPALSVARPGRGWRQRPRRCWSACWR